jgi:protein O-GlcNAc transferase
LFTLHYDPSNTPELLFNEHVKWATRHAPPAPARPHDNDRSPGRRLRVGYVSADFREHPVAHFILPILMSYDRDQLEVYCYSDVTQPDSATQRLRPFPNHWRETAGLPDETLTELVRSDRIDILVDLAGLRLLAFARRPAPVQVTYFNYPDTTGMSAMDYRVTDELAEPTGVSEAYSTEHLVRLPHCGWCYDPGADVPEVNPLPRSANGHVTFASLNNPIKHSEPTVVLWAKVLHAMPDSRLLLLGVDADPANPTLAARFASHGIGRERLRFAPQRPRRPYLELYHEADVALDPFPYNGGVTSCDALWMGVPLVTLEGNTYHSRQGVMLLTNLGLKDLIARTPEAYVDVAVALATDPARLAHLRSQLRSRMAASPIGDGAAFTRGLQAAYRAMWTRWCEVVTGRACHHDERRSRLP